MDFIKQLLKENRTESQALAERYIDYLEADRPETLDQIGMDFDLVPNTTEPQAIKIYQDVEGIDEPDEYRIIRDEVDPETWDRLLSMLLHY